mgnify:CR=1 FL=1
MRPETRTTLLKLHRWVGLAFAALLLVQGLSGALLVFREEIEGVIHPALAVMPAETRVPVQSMVDTVREAAPRATLQRIKFAEDPARAAMFVMRLEDDAPWIVAVDPYNGRIVRAGSYAAWPGEWLFRLHDALLAGKTGEIIVSIEGIALVFLVGFGVVIWWPGRRRLKSGFRILTGQGADRTVRTAHRAVGAAIGIVLVMSGMTGAHLIHRAALQPYLPVVPRPKFEVALSPETPLRPVDTLLADIDIDGVQGFLKQLQDNVRESLPESAFDELKSKAEIATATLELQLQELVLKVKRARPNYDAGMVQAMRLAGRAAADMGLSDVAPLDDELLELDDERPVLRADLDTRERVDYLLKSGAPQEKVWEALGVEQDEIAEWRRILDERRANFNDMLDSDGETEL